uniref:Ovule protein n=1 Tax=Ascaris lumbricoides TaxID=6252 RepID=A0A0M3II53_ASCLU
MLNSAMSAKEALYAASSIISSINAASEHSKTNPQFQMSAIYAKETGHLADPNENRKGRPERNNLSDRIITTESDE